MSLSKGPHSWWKAPFAQALVRFNLLPSLGLHRSRAAGWPIEPGSAPLSVHRRASAALAKELGLSPALASDDPGLPLALLPSPAFDRLILFCGIGIHASQVRRAITREEVAWLREQLGHEGIAFARGRLPPVPAALTTNKPWQPDRARSLCIAAGAALLDLAFDSSAAAVATRARLRLPQDAGTGHWQAVEAGLTSQHALALALEYLALLEPEWLSSFPATR